MKGEKKVNVTIFYQVDLWIRKTPEFAEFHQISLLYDLLLYIFVAEKEVYQRLKVNSRWSASLLILVVFVISYEVLMLI